MQDISFVFVTPELKWRPVSTKVVEVHAQPGPMLARYCKTGAEDLLMDIIAKKEQNGKSDSTHLVKEVVQLLLGGGDGTLHYILAGYVSLTYSGKLAGKCIYVSDTSLWIFMCGVLFHSQYCSSS